MDIFGIVLIGVDYVVKFWTIQIEFMGLLHRGISLVIIWTWLRFVIFLLVVYVGRKRGYVNAVFTDSGFVACYCIFNPNIHFVWFCYRTPENNIILKCIKLLVFNRYKNLRINFLVYCLRSYMFPLC